MEPITWNGCVYHNYDLIHLQMYERILALERLLKEKSINDLVEYPPGHYPIGSTMPNGTKVTAKR